MLVEFVQIGVDWQLEEEFISKFVLNVGFRVVEDRIVDPCDQRSSVFAYLSPASECARNDLSLSKSRSN